MTIAHGNRLAAYREFDRAAEATAFVTVHAAPPKLSN
jgi:hypothetical protein